ncbi:acyl-CoA desaturase [Streptomyces kanamyceticus]|uniref:Acyl-CoA desaturase n=1 Tax=Streptomyces kanamyceticus TaxID=1967 RepID=A0A5J6GSV9_STRKN|nr:acyl-CoA desaturase [Streptomyces kanamyceticus]QEU97454.1 acyl-CoA desaturase [Streptomyces kanamyceticus]
MHPSSSVDRTQTRPRDAASTAYDGSAPFPADDGPATARSGGERLYVAITGAIVALPFLALGLAVWLLWGSLIHPADVALALILYTVTGLGITVGFHRGLTHGGYTAARPVRIALAVAGSMSFQGDVIGWVATHRRHHAFTDRPGDPHSPYRYGTHLRGQLRGLAHSHVGWLFRNDPTPAERYAPDLLADRDIRAVSRAFPALCVLTLALPFGLGWAIGGSWAPATTALLWAGLVRIALLHHVTWSVNSLCHLVGERPFRTRRHDRATNLWPLALISFGESWHNLHHADPTSARHGVDRGQIDPSAAVIRLLEHVGWVRDVRWPTPDRIATRRT